MSFVRYFGEMILKNGEGGPCLEFRVLCSKVGSSPIDPEITDRQAIGQPQLAEKELQESELALVSRDGNIEYFFLILNQLKPHMK